MTAPAPTPSDFAWPPQADRLIHLSRLLALSATPPPAVRVLTAACWDSAAGAECGATGTVAYHVGVAVPALPTSTLLPLRGVGKPTHAEQEEDRRIASALGRALMVCRRLPRDQRRIARAALCHQVFHGLLGLGPSGQDSIHLCWSPNHVGLLREALVRPIEPQEKAQAIEQVIDVLDCVRALVVSNIPNDRPRTITRMAAVFHLITDWWQDGTDVSRTARPTSWRTTLMIGASESGRALVDTLLEECPNSEDDVFGRWVRDRLHAIKAELDSLTLVQHTQATTEAAGPTDRTVFQRRM